jgi:hypothetical protein
MWLGSYLIYELQNLLFILLANTSILESDCFPQINLVEDRKSILHTAKIIRSSRIYASERSRSRCNNSRTLQWKEQHSPTEYFDYKENSLLSKIKYSLIWFVWFATLIWVSIYTITSITSLTRCCTLSYIG